MKKVLKGKKQHGSIIITALLMIVILSLLGWTFIYVVNNLAIQSQNAYLSKQSYYAADAGIERAALRLWDRFKSCGIGADKMSYFEDSVDDAWNDYYTGGTYAGDFYVENLDYGITDNSKMSYQVFVQKVEPTDTTQVTVRITSIGRAFPNKNNLSTFSERRITADVRYYLAGSRIMEFAYYMHNLGWHSGDIKNAGSMGSNGFIKLEGNPDIAGGDRYATYEDGQLSKKLNDGGLFAAGGFRTTNYEGFEDILPGKNATGTGAKTKVDKYSPTSSPKFTGYNMPVMSQLSYYEDYAKEREAESSKYGLYVTVPNNTRLYNPSGKYPVGEPDPAKRYDVVGLDSVSNKVKLSDAVYGDGTVNGTYYRVANSGTTQCWKLGEKNNLLLTSPDSANPIEIYGTVVVRGNVIMKGIYKGAGCIYSGQNIYVAGGIQYSRPPSKADGSENTNPTSWNFRGFVNNNDADSDVNDTKDEDNFGIGDTGEEGMALSLAKAEENQETWLANNAPAAADTTGKDIIGLFANKNIAQGDMSDKDTRRSIRMWSNYDMINDGYMNEKIAGESYKSNLNATDEAVLGLDKVHVPNSRIASDTKECTAENNGVEVIGDKAFPKGTGVGWDVEFYTEGNPPPDGATHPVYKDGSNNPKPFATVTPERIEQLKTLAYSSWTETDKLAVIPGMGEDINGNGIYDRAADLSSMSFSGEPGNSSLNDPNNVGAWSDALKIDPNAWGGTIDPNSEANAKNYSTIFSQYNPTGRTGIYTLDPFIYTNGIIGGRSNSNSSKGGFFGRVEAMNSSGPSHDDRLVAGAQYLRKHNILVPQTEHMEYLRWIE